MPAFDLEPQVVMTTPLLEGLDGVEKMSKSLGNYVGVTDAPAEMFGKLMSISDELMWRYYALLTDLTATDVTQLRDACRRGALHPKQAKIDLARRIVARLSSAGEAERGGGGVRAAVRRSKELPDRRWRSIEVPDEEWNASIEKRLVDCGLAESDERRAAQSCNRGASGSTVRRCAGHASRSGRITCCRRARLTLVLQVGTAGAAYGCRRPG